MRLAQKSFSDLCTVTTDVNTHVHAHSLCSVDTHTHTELYLVLDTKNNFLLALMLAKMYGLGVLWGYSCVEFRGKPQLLFPRSYLV